MKFWSQKDTISSQEEAVEALADFLSSSEGIRSAIKNKLDEAESFAHKWSIPFDRSFISKMVVFQDAKRYDGDSALARKGKSEKEMFEEFKQECAEEIEEDKKKNPQYYEDEDDYENLIDWFHDWKCDAYSTDHTWQSSSEHC